MVRRSFLALLALILTATACGADAADGEAGPTGSTDSTAAEPNTTSASEPSTATTEPVSTSAPVAEGFPITVTAANGDVEIADRPEAIVSISPTATEILFEIGAGAQVIAVDDLSNYPPDAPVTDLSAFTPNVEAIAEFNPDLVVLSFDPGSIEDGLEALGIPVVIQSSAATIDDTYSQIEQLGAATGNLGAAAELVARIQIELDEVEAEFGAAGGEFTYYHELDDTFFTATSATFIGELYSLLGLINIADGEDIDGFGFPQLSAEFIVDIDPDFIFLADTKCCGQTLETVAARPGWENLTAVTSNAVVELDDDVASRWGPRVVDLLEVIAAAVRSLETTG